MNERFQFIDQVEEKRFYYYGSRPRLVSRSNIITELNTQE